jgi:Ca2+-binding RTX toxin-like protein
MPLTAATKTDLYRFFVLAFDAAPGVTYMNQLAAASDSGMSVKQIVNEFTKKSEFTSVYFTFLTNEEFATKFINNAVAPTTTAEAKAEAVSQIVAALNSGYSRGDVVYQAFINLANLTSDAKWGDTAKLLNNQVAYAQYFTETLGGGAEATPSLAALKAVVAGVTSTTDVSTPAAIDAVLNPPVIEAGKSFSLTSGVDSIQGGTGDDTIVAATNGTASLNTLNSADIINGGAGTDTLYVNLAQAFSPVAGRITNVENLVLQSPSVNLDVTAISGLKSIDVQNPSGGVNVSNVTAGTSLSVSNATGAHEITVRGTGLTGDSDTLSLALSGVSGDSAITVKSTDTNGIEALSITTSGIASGSSTNSLTVNVQDSAGTSTVKSITVAGDAALALDAVGALVKTIDGSKMTAGLNVSSAAVTNATVTGGSGADVFTGGAGNDVINSGAGADTVTAGAGNDSVNAGDGNDTVIVSSINKNDTISGGDGSDTLSLASALAFSTTSGTNDGSGITGFETLRATGSFTQNMKALAGNSISAVTLGASAALVMQESPTVGTLNAGNSGTLSIGLATNGSADTMEVKAGSTTATVAVTVNANAYEIINVASTGTAGNTVSIGQTVVGTEAAPSPDALTATQSTSLQKVTVTGNKSLTLTTGANALSLASVDASAFTGDTFSFTGSSNSTTAINVTANGGYGATITTAKGADTVTLGDPGSSSGHTVSTGDGADTVTSGGGNDTLTMGDGNNVALGGAGNDTISGGTGNDWFKGEAGNDSLTGSSGNDTLEGGDGIDTISAGAGADSIDAGDGNDTIDASTGNDFVSAGAGADTIDAGTGDDTVDGGAGNDVITLGSLTSGDSINGGDGAADRLTITTVAADSTPSGISGIEDFRIGTFGVDTSTTGITVDFTKVSGFTSTSFTNNSSAAATNAIKNLPSTLTTLSIADTAGLTAADTLNLSYSSGPASMTLNVFDVMNAATGITSLSAPLTINGKLTTNLAGDSQVFTSGLGSNLGNLTTDATTITLNTDALPAGTYADAELTVGTITDTVLQSLTISAGANAGIQLATGVADNAAVSNVSTSSAEFAAMTLSTGTNGTVRMGTLTAANATSVALSLNPGTQGNITLGTVSALGAAVSLSGTFGDQSQSANGANGIVIGDSISSSNVTVGAGVTANLPTLQVDNATKGIGSVTVSSGVSSNVSQTVGTTAGGAGGATPATIGAITATGSGRVNITVGATAGATNPDATTSSAMGAVSASGMTSSLSVFNFNGVAAIARMTITGGSGNDTLVGGTGADTITGGAGSDNLTSTAGNDIFVFNVGESNAVETGVNGTANGQDLITDQAAGDLMRFNITSADTAWDIATHVLVGTGGGTTTVGAATSYTTASVLVQAGTHTDTADTFDIVVRSTNVYADAAAAQAASVINLTGTSGNDTLTVGANNDTVSGGDGNDNITGAAGNDSLTGGNGNDTIAGDAGADTINGGAGNDSITGGTGADAITGGDGADIYIVAAGSSALTIGGAGDSGTISGFDSIADFVLGSSAANAESLDMAAVTEAVVANTAGTNGADSNLTISGAVVKSHAISGGIATFSNADVFSTALTLTSTAHLAAVVEYLQANDLGDAGATVAFVVGSDTYVFMQGDDTGTNNLDVLVKLTGVTGTSVSATNGTTTGLIDIGG